MEAELELHYTPDQISRYLRSWPELCAQAERASSPRYLPSGAQPSKGHTPANPWAAHVVADIERAIKVSLGGRHTEWHVVNYRMLGWSFGRMGEALHLTKQTCHYHYQAAVRRIAEQLGWVEPPPQPEEERPVYRVARAVDEV